MHLKNGAVLKRGEYGIEKLLGQGGFGITYLAVQSGLDRKVAIKEFFMKDLCERDADTSSVTLGTSGSRQTVIRFKEKFIREAKTIASLRHPNIVNIYDVFEENGTAYYVMEYHDGGSLSSLDLPLSVDEASGYIRQIASALSYLHKRNTMHLDVKPSNILLDESGNAVLIDFGVSKHYDAEDGSQTSSTPVGLSRGYAPLEQNKSGGVSQFTPSTDIYSLGATFYKLITGHTPPEADDVYEDGLPPFPSSVPSEIASVIEKSMQPRRKDRPQSIEEFLGLLDAALAVPVPAEDPDESTEIETVEAVAVDDSEPVPTPSHESRQSSKKPSRKWLWLLLALFVAFTCAAAVLFMGNPSSSTEADQARSDAQQSVSKSPTEADQARSDAQQYASLMEMGAEFEENDATLLKAKEKYTSAKELEEKWSQSKDYGSLFCQDAAGALKRVENKLKELEEAESKKKAAEEQFNDDLTRYNDLISAADKLCDKGDESSLKSAIEKYKSAAEIESGYTRIEYSDRFNRNASASAGRAVKRLSEVQAAAELAKEQAAAKKKAEEATKNKAVGSASLTGTHKNHEWVDLGLSVKWATCNVGASRPGDYGKYYAWGDTRTKSTYTDNNSDSYGSSDSKWKNIGGKPSYDAARASWGGDWRLPTEKEFEELCEHCTWEWTTQNGHNGYKVTSKKNGQSIFLPAAGWRYGADENGVGSNGFYWSSTPYEDNADCAYGLGFGEVRHGVSWGGRSYGFSVRPVLED